jgi:hypothetical protein
LGPALEIFSRYSRVEKASGEVVTLKEYLEVVWAAGVISRSESGAVVIDLDGDGDERTGWTVFYFHIETEGRTPVGSVLQIGDPIGHPSCEGGRATGTHIHIARKYNGEWIPADYVIPFDLGGWVAHNGSYEYEGTLTKAGNTIIACTCADAASQIYADE